MRTWPLPDEIDTKAEQDAAYAELAEAHDQRMDDFDPKDYQ